MRFFRFTAVALVFAATLATARADDMTPVAGEPATTVAGDPLTADAVQAATELLSIMSPDFMSKIMTQMNNALWPGLMARSGIPPTDLATVAAMRSAFETIELTQLQMMMKEAAPIYARYFTADELRQLVAFYRTPLGQKAIEKIPQVMGDFLGRIAPMLKEVQNEAEAAFRRVLAEHGYPKN